MQTFFIAVGALIMAVALCFGLDYLAFQENAFFAPKRVEVERRVFEQSRAYNEGMVRDLENLKMQYDVGDVATRATLKPVIIHRFSVYTSEQLPPDLWTFYQGILK